MFMIKKVKTEIPEVFMAFTHTIKVKKGSFLKARIRIQSKIVRIRNTAYKVRLSPPLRQYIETVFKQEGSDPTKLVLGL
jgi:hypothetical protein